jgi:hypothetical protein
LQGPSVALELHRPAAVLRPTAGVAQLGPVHPWPRDVGLSRPDVLGQRSARLWHPVEFAAVAVGDGRLQVQEAIRRGSRRMTTNCRTEVEQHVASAGGEGEATPNPEWGEGDCRPIRRFELSIRAEGGRGGTSDTDSEKAVNFAQWASVRDLDYFPSGPFVAASRIPSAAGRGVRSRLRAAADKGSTISCELGRVVQ